MEERNKINCLDYKIFFRNLFGFLIFLYENGFILFTMRIISDATVEFLTSVLRSYNIQSWGSGEKAQTLFILDFGRLLCYRGINLPVTFSDKTTD